MTIGIKSILRMLRGYIASAIEQQSFNMIGGAFNDMAFNAVASVFYPLTPTVDEQFNRSKIFHTFSLYYDNDRNGFINGRDAFDMFALIVNLNFRVRSTDPTLQGYLYLRVRVLDENGTQKYIKRQDISFQCNEAQHLRINQTALYTFISAYDDTIIIEIASSVAAPITVEQSAFTFWYGTRYKNVLLPDTVLYESEE